MNRKPVISISNGNLRVQAYSYTDENKLRFQLDQLSGHRHIWKCVTDRETDIVIDDMSHHDIFEELNNFFYRLMSQLTPVEQNLYSDKLYMSEKTKKKDIKNALQNIKKKFLEIKIA